MNWSDVPAEFSIGPALVLLAGGVVAGVAATGAWVWQRIWRGYRADQLKLRAALSAVETAHSAIAITDASGKLQYVNSAFARVWGLDSAEQALGQPLTSFWVDTSEARAVKCKLVAEGSWRGSLEARLADGETQSVTVSGLLLRDVDGAPAGILASFTPASDREKLEQDVRHERRFTAALIEAAPVVIVLLNPDGRIERVNRQFELLTGFQRDELLGADWFSTMVPEYERPRLRLELERILAGEPSVGIVNPVRSASGDEVWIEWSNALLRNDDGTPRSVVCFGTDVTQRMRVERELQRNEEHLVEAQRIGRIGSWELDLVSGRLTWSDEIYRIFGLDPANFPASYEGFLDAIHPEDRELVDAAYRHAVESREEYYIRHRLRARDGGVRWVEERARTWYADDGGAPLRSAGTVQDITDYVQSQETISRALAEKEILLREIHHRVKNNLQVVASLLYFSAKKSSTPADATNFLEARERLRAMALVHETLYRERDVGRIGFAAYCQSLLVQVTESHGSAGGHSLVRTRVLGDCEVPADIAAPCGMLVVELVNNAFKHAFPGNAAGDVTVEMAPRGNRLTLVVADTGIGLPPDFDPSQQESFGWQLVLGLVQQLGAELTLVPGPGTVVRVAFEIPAADFEPSPIAVAAGAP